jgi:hypothetical protein
MLKLLTWNVVLSVNAAIANAIVLPAIAADESLVNFSQLTQLSTDDINLVCYMQTTDGRVVDLSRICGQNVNANGETAVNPTIVNVQSSLGGLEAFRGGSGTPPCYVLDAQGLPCPPIR